LFVFECLGRPLLEELRETTEHLVNLTMSVTFW
jgi:hypothetical protein